MQILDLSTRVYRRRGKRFADGYDIERDRFGGGSVLVWGGIMAGNKTRLIVINGNVNAQTYINDVFAVEALPFIQFHGPNACSMVTFMHDNARPRSPTITRQVLERNNVNVLDWPANSPDLNPIGQVWDELGRRVQRNAIHTENDLRAALQAEWANLPVPCIQRYVNNMRRRITNLSVNSVHCTKWWTHQILTHFIESSVCFC